MSCLQRLGTSKRRERKALRRCDHDIVTQGYSFGEQLFFVRCLHCKLMAAVRATNPFEPIPMIRQRAIEILILNRKRPILKRTPAPVQQKTEDDGVLRGVTG